MFNAELQKGMLAGTDCLNKLIFMWIAAIGLYIKIVTFKAIGDNTYVVRHHFELPKY